MKAHKSLRYTLYEKRKVPWEPWFAWRPVTTITGQWIWWRHIYRKYANTYVDHDDFTWYHYADEFEILQQTGFDQEFDILTKR